jgi:dipeptidyl aminopeptidase/acylaminoacyl peptidase
MMRHSVLFIAFLLTACSSLTLPLTGAPSQPTPPITTVPALSTALPPATSAPVELPTFTPLPTFTSTTAPTFTSTPNPHAIINAGNASQVALLGKIELPEGRKIAFSPDGKFIATSSGNQSDFAVNLWQTDRSLQTTIDQYNGIVWDIAFSPDGQFIVSVADDPQGQTVRIWGVPDGSLVQNLLGPSNASSVVFSPDGRIMAVGGLAGWPNGIIWLYDTITWNPIHEVPAPGQNVTALAFSPDGLTLVSSGTDGNIRFWQVSNGALLKTLYYARQANSIALSPDGALLASVFCTSTNAYGCTKGGLVVWRLNDGVVLQQFNDLAESVAFSPNGQLLVSGSRNNDPNIRLRSVADWTLLKTLTGPADNVAFSPDGATIVSVDFQAIKLYGISQ